MSQDGNRSHRLSILTASEIDDLFGLPSVTDEDRRLYFGLSAVEQEAAAAYTFAVAAHFAQRPFISATRSTS
jgi:hypothetical protein